MESIKQDLFRLSKCIGVAGDESSASEAAKEMLSKYTSNIKTDNMGNIIAEIFPRREGKPYVLLDAHIDEIGMIVTFIDAKGFLHVSNCGGVDRRLLLAQRVIVHSKEKLFGVIASKPPHLESAEDAKKVPEVVDVLIDIGLSQDEAKQKVSLGDRVTIQSESHELLNNRVATKAIDDKAGIVSILKALEILSEKKPDCGLGVLFSVQEETGERGARVGGFTVDPDIAIAVDVSFAYTSDAVEHKCGKMGEGVMVGIAPTLTRQISKDFEQLAKQAGIKYQLEVMGGETSTNADALGVTKKGVKTGLLSIPLRYMHTPIEVVQMEDIENTAKLLAEFVLKAGEVHA
jgi:endoglucanase